VVLATTRKLQERDRILALPATQVDLLITGCEDEQAIGEFRKLGIEVRVASDGQEDGVPDSGHQTSRPSESGTRETS
jgi:hypothetical protein